MPNPKWFDEAYYATQKVAQMNATGYDDAGWLAGQNATEWTVDLYNKYLAQYTIDGKPVTAYDNFVACNGKDYGSDIDLGDINVSANRNFNITEYLQALADYNNAHPDAWTEGQAPEGGWNVANQLDAIFDNYHASVWEHYNANWDTLLINPSNSFDTSAYLEARAKAMGGKVEDAIKAIKDAGLNPIQDYEDFGKEHDITLTRPADPVAPVLPDAGWTVWGDPVTPPAPVTPPDPFEQDVTEVAIAKDKLDYPGDGESYSGNTKFDAAWLPSSADSTLNAKDHITGPEGDTYNTLSVTLGKNWTGFSGIKQEDGTVAPSVDNIGRVELIHNPANNEASYTFDAKNISEDAYRYDLVGADGPGAINLKNLSATVNEIRLSGITPKDVNGKAPDPTDLSFVEGAHKGRNDALTLVVENVGAQGADEVITGKNFGIEQLTVQAQKGDGRSFLDLSKLEGVKTLKFTGDGDLTVSNVASGISTYDASEAKGGINMAIVSPRSSTVVKGGEGWDTVTLKGNGSWKPASLDSIEALSIDGATVNLENVAGGLNDLWVGKAGGTLKNVSSDDFKVHLYNDAGSDVTVNGARGDANNLGNITFEADKQAGDITTSATGVITFNVSEDSKGFTAGNIVADSATALVVNAACDVTLGDTASSMKNIQDVTLNLEDSNTNNALDATNIKVDLPSAQNVTVNAGGQNVTLGNLGDPKKNDSSITLDVNDANDFTVGKVETTLGCNVNIDIEASQAVKFGSAISNDTDLLSGGQGDISINVAGDSVSGVDATGAASTTITGGPMTINFGDVDGNVYATGKELVLNSVGTISYTGAQGNDYVKVTKVGDGTSTFDMGDGADNLAFANLAIGKGNTANVEITVDGSNDTLSLTAATSGKLYYTVNGLSVAPQTQALAAQAEGDATPPAEDGAGNTTGGSNAGGGTTEDTNPPADDDSQTPGNPADPGNPDGPAGDEEASAPVAFDGKITDANKAAAGDALNDAFGVDLTADQLDDLVNGNGKIAVDGAAYAINYVSADTVTVVAIIDSNIEAGMNLDGIFSA